MVLIGRLASFARVNEYGFIETPYRRVLKALAPSDQRLIGRHCREEIAHPKTGEVILKPGDEITEKIFKALQKIEKPQVMVVPFISEEVEYLSADREDKFVIAQANAVINEFHEFSGTAMNAAITPDFIFSTPENINYMDVAPHQVVGISAALIPFLEHDDANRALMGSNMMAQAVPLLNPDIPLISTGMEYCAALDSGQVVDR